MSRGNSKQAPTGTGWVSIYSYVMSSKVKQMEKTITEREATANIHYFDESCGMRTVGIRVDFVTANLVVRGHLQ